MFYSHEILSKKGKLGLIWLVANFSSAKSMNLTRREYCSVNVSQSCDDILNPVRPFALRLSAKLLTGIMRIHLKQTDYVYIDIRAICRKLQQSFYTDEPGASSLGINLPTAKTRRDLVTLPDPLKQPLADYILDFGTCASLPQLNTSSRSEDYFILSGSNSTLIPAIPKSPEMRPGSVSGSPHTADPKDISIKEDQGIPIESLEIKVPGERDFGEEGAFLQDLDLIMEGLEAGEGRGEEERATCKAGGSRKRHRNEERGEGAAQDNNAVQEKIQDVHVTATVQDTTQDDANMLGTTQDGSLLEDQQHLSFGYNTPPKEVQKVTPQSHSTPGGVPDEKELALPPTKRRRVRRPKRLVWFDQEIKLSTDEMRHNLSTGETTLFSRAELFPWFSAKRVAAKDLLFQPTSTSVSKNPSFLSAWKSAAVLCPENREDPLAVADSSPTSPKDDVSDIELVFRTTAKDLFVPYVEHASASHISDASKGSSIDFETSSSQRPTMARRRPFGGLGGDLSPIMDVPNLDMDDTLEAFSVAAPLPLPSSGEVKGTSCMEFYRHIAAVMGSRSVVEFQELLPADATRKIASKAFSHVLELSTKRVLSVEQSMPYGPILLRRGEAFNTP